MSIIKENRAAINARKPRKRRTSPVNYHDINYEKVDGTTGTERFCSVEKFRSLAIQEFLNSRLVVCAW